MEVQKGIKTVVILDNIRSVYNVGSIFRTCDAAGVSKIYLCGTTPTPIDRFGRARKDLAKVALGAETAVPWEHVSDTKEAISACKAEGGSVIAVEQAEDALDHRKLEVAGLVAFVFGNEVDGISQEIRNLCDQTIEIPMHGSKESLNVAVSVGVILFSMR